jgi:hypothetical protein
VTYVTYELQENERSCWTVRNSRALTTAITNNNKKKCYTATTYQQQQSTVMP